MPTRRKNDAPTSDAWQQRKPNGGRELLYKLIPTVVAALIAGAASYVAVRTELATVSALLDERTISIREEIRLRDDVHRMELAALRQALRDHVVDSKGS